MFFLLKDNQKGIQRFIIIVSLAAIVIGIVTGAILGLRDKSSSVDLKSVMVSLAGEPEWLTYDDFSLSFQYPKTLCGTAWQTELATGLCDSSWRVERTNSGLSVTAGGEEDFTGEFFHIISGYKNTTSQSGSDIFIELVSKKSFETDMANQNLTLQPTNRGYQIVVVENITRPSGKMIAKYYLTNNSKYIIIHNSFPNRYPKYMDKLISSLILK